MRDDEPQEEFVDYLEVRPEPGSAEDEEQQFVLQNNREARTSLQKSIQNFDK